MAMRMLQQGGASIVEDGIRTADSDNPRGYFELEMVKQLDKGGDQGWLRDARGKAVKIISALLLHLPSDHNFKVVFMQRDISEVLASQQKMLINRSEANTAEDSELRTHYEQHLEKVEFILRRRPQFDTLWVPHREVIDSPATQARRIEQFLGLGLNVDRMAEAVDRKLYRNRAEATRA